jgi:hypothetical protein
MRSGLTMLGIPAIGASVVIWKCRLQTFERHVCRAHDGLAHVVKAVDHVPVVVVWNSDVRLQTRVGLDDSVEAMQLVGH